MVTSNLLWELNNPCIFAHRGASNYAPENTIAAFDLAIQQNADAIELDAKLCADGNIVVIHDQTVDRTTPASGKVADMTLAELRILDAGSHFDIAFHRETIPTLDQVLEAIGKRIYINIELSNYASLNDSLPQKAAAIVKRHNLGKWIMFSSFNPLALLHTKRLLPDVPIGLIALSGQRGFWARSRLGYLLNYQALHSHFSDIDASQVESQHKRSCRLHPYTVNSAKEMLRLKQFNVDGIITDDPLLAHKVLNDRHPTTAEKTNYP